MTFSIRNNAQAEQKDEVNQNLNLIDLFAQDAQRFEKFSVQFKPLSFDFSKHRIDQFSLDFLVNYAKEKSLSG